MSNEDWGGLKEGFVAQDAPTMLTEDVSLQKAQKYHFSGRGFLNSCQPQCCAVCMEYSHFSQRRLAGFSLVDTAWFCHSAPIPGLLQRFQEFLIILSLSLCLYFLRSPEYGSWKWIRYFIYCPSKYYFILLCGSGSSAASTKVRFFLSAINSFTSLPTFSAGKAIGSLGCFGLIIWSCLVDVGKLGRCAEELEWTGAERWQGLIQRVKNLGTALPPFPPWAGVQLWARMPWNSQISFHKIGFYQCLCLIETLI